MLQKKAALSIDNNLTPQLEADIKSGKYTLEDGVPLPLSANDKAKIIYRKYEAESDEITDTKHKEWEEIMIAHPKVAILGMEDRLLDDDVSGVSTDDGLIMKFKGEPTQTVCIDARSMRVIPEDQADIEEEATGITFNRYTEWGFHLEEVKLTNGPEARQKLSETYEKQKNQEQAEMFSSMEKFFGKLMNKLGDSGAIVNSPEQLAETTGVIADPTSVLKGLLGNNSPEQLKAMIEMEQAEGDVPEAFTKEELQADKLQEESLNTLADSGGVEEASAKKRGKKK